MRLQQRINSSGGSVSQHIFNKPMASHVLAKILLHCLHIHREEKQRLLQSAKVRVGGQSLIRNNTPASRQSQQPQTFENKHRRDSTSPADPLALETVEKGSFQRQCLGLSVGH